MSKTESKILEILNENNELVSYEIQRGLEELGYSVNYDTVWRNLKRMTEEGKLIRQAKAKKRERKYGWEDKRQPWYYHYKLNKNYLEK